MPSENTGNVITAIKFLKDKVVILFGKMRLEITKEAYTSAYYYVGKSLSDEDIEKIERDNKKFVAIKYAKSIIARKMISEWELRSKLYEKEFEKEVIDEVVLVLKKEKLINDKAFCKEYVSYYNSKLYGKVRIIRELRLRGIFDETIQEIVFSDNVELRKAKALLSKLEKEYAKYAYAEKKQHIYNALIRYGFTNEIAMEVVKRIKKTRQSEETNMLRRDFALVLDRGLKRYKNEADVKDYVFKTLFQKGYKMAEIKRIWEER